MTKQDTPAHIETIKAISHEGKVVIWQEIRNKRQSKNGTHMNQNPNPETNCDMTSWKSRNWDIL